jgi:hypothetical protein
MPLSPFAAQSTTMQAYQGHVTRIRHQPWANGDDDWVWIWAIGLCSHSVIGRLLFSQLWNRIHDTSLFFLGQSGSWAAIAGTGPSRTSTVILPCALKPGSTRSNTVISGYHSVPGTYSSWIWHVVIISQALTVVIIILRKDLECVELWRSHV